MYSVKRDASFRSGLYLSNSKCCNTPQRMLLCSLCQNMTLLPHKQILCLLRFLLFFNFMFSPSLFTQVYIITYSTLPDSFKMTPTGTVCLTMATIYTLPKTRIAFTPQIQTNMAVILQFPFITNGNKIQWWREIEGNIQMILAPGYVCGEGELIASHCG